MSLPKPSQARPNPADLVATSALAGPVSQWGCSRGVEEREFRDATAIVESRSFATWLIFDAPHRPDSLGRIDSYEILCRIGRGGMGIVFKAFDERRQALVAIKAMSSELSSRQISRQRFEREARAAEGIDHPNVVATYGISAFHGVPYLVMEFVDGCSLKERIASNVPLDFQEIVSIGAQVAAGLAAAHSKGVVHRDIKPSNVMLERDTGQVKIADFGLACVPLEPSELSSMENVLGTPAYMSPEQVKGEELDARSDLFNLGILLYAMIAKASPFQAVSPLVVANRIASVPHRSLSEINPETPTFLVKIVDRLLQKEPADRYQSAEEVERHLSEQLVRMEGEKEEGLLSVESTIVPKTTGRTFASQRMPPSIEALVWASVFAATAIGIWALPISTLDATGSDENSRSSMTLPPGPDIVPVLASESPTSDSIVSETFSHGGKVNGIAVSESGRGFSADETGSIAFWSLDGSVEPVVFEEAPSRVADVALTHSAEEVVTVAKDGVLRRRSAADGTLRLEAQVSSNALNAIAAIPGTDEVVIGGWDRTIRICRVDDGSIIQQIPANDTDIHCVAVSPDGTRIIWAGRSGKAFLWNREGQQIERTFVGHTDLIAAIAFSPDGTLCASAGYDHTVRVWEVATGEELVQFVAFFPRALQFFSDSRTLVFGNRGESRRIGGKLDIVDVVSKQVLQSTYAGADIDAVAICPDEEAVLVGDVSGRIARYALPLSTP